MTPERWQRIEALFSEAQELQPSEREAWLSSECEGDVALLSEVKSLLEQDSVGNEMLDAQSQPWSGLLTARDEAKTLIEGTDFGPYVIGRLLGAGGMGEVYLAQDRRLRRKVALKLLATWLRPDPSIMLRFTKEALSASALNHPNIPVVFETGEFEGRRFIASEYVDGLPLTERLQAGPIPWREAVAIATRVAEALQAAHQAGIIHRDVKPGNILVCADGRVKLVDFGIAKFGASLTEGRADAAPTSFSEQAPMTRIGMVLGTPGYMPPEQADGMSADARSDLWGLAAVLHHMLTGQRVNQAHGQVTRRAGIPRPLLSVLERGLQPDPDRRWQTAQDFIRALQVATRRAQWLAMAPLWGSAAVLLLGALGLATERWIAPLVGLAPVPPSLLVLRFDNPGADAQTDYLSVGIQGEIQDHIARISGLQVLSPQVSAKLPTRPANLAELGRRYHVGNVLEGSVRIEGQRVHVEARLVDAEGGRLLWSDSYDRERRDVFELERDIAERVAARLSTVVSASEQTALNTADTRNPDAHAAFLRAQFFRSHADPVSLQKAVDNYQTALQIDPGYATASAGLSIATFKLAAQTDGPQLLQLKARARAAAERAVRLGPGLAEPHVALGWVFLTWDWDFAAAEHEFHIAVDLAPNSAPGKNALGTLASVLGQFDRASRLIEAGQRLDPVSASYPRNLALVRMGQGRMQDAERLLREALELEPQSRVCHDYLAQIALMRGDTQTAEREARLETDSGLRDFVLALLAQQDRKPGVASAALARYITANQADSPYRIAGLYAVRGETDEALRWLDRAYDIRDEELMDVMTSPLLVKVRKDPRFLALRNKLGIPAPASPAA